MPQRDIKVEGRGRWYDLPSKQPFLPWASVSISLWCGEAESGTTLQYVLIVTFFLCKTRRKIYFRLWNIKKKSVCISLLFLSECDRGSQFSFAQREDPQSCERKVWTDKMVFLEPVGKIDVLLCACNMCGLFWHNIWYLQTVTWMNYHIRLCLVCCTSLCIYCKGKIT